MTKQSYLRMIERNKEKELKKNDRINKKAQKLFFKKLEKKIKQSSDGNFFPFGCYAEISPNEPEIERIKTKYPFLNFEFEIKGSNVLIVTWRLKHD
jgi:hypothetical protein